MQGNNQGSENTNNKQSGLSWTQPASTNTPASPASGSAPAAKPAAAQTKPAQKTASASTPAMPAANARTLWLIVGGIVVLGLLVWGVAGITGSRGTPGAATSTSSASTNNNSKGSTTAMVSNVVVSQTPPAQTGSLQFAVGNQSAGAEVAVTGVRVSQPAWLVVYESINNLPGNALGAAMVFPENNGQAAVIPLLRGTTAGRTYFVGESIDNGDRTFSLEADTKILNSDGSLAVQEFTAR